MSLAGGQSVGLSAGRLWAVAANTSREALRSRALLGLLLSALAFLLFSLVLAALAVRGEGGRVVVDFGIFAIGLFLTAIAITTGTILVHKEIDRKTIFNLVTKPVHRHEILIGKYVGMMLNLGVVLGVLGAAWFALLRFQQISPTVDVAYALVLLYGEAAIIAAVAILFSSFSSPILSGLFTFGVFLLGRTAWLVQELLDSPHSIFATSPALRPLGEVWVALCPDLSLFQKADALLAGVPIGLHFTLASLGYALAYVAFFLVCAIILFERRDFT